MNWVVIIRSIVVWGSLCLTACGSSDSWPPPYNYQNQPPVGSGPTQQPTTINLYPSSEGSRLYVMVTAVESQVVSMPLAFDTGCPTNDYTGPQTINGYLVCQKAIPDTTVTIAGVANGNLTGNVLFDSGTPDMILYPPNSSFPSSVLSGTAVLVMTPSGFDYSHKAGLSQTTDTSVNANVNNDQTHVGVAYFTTNFFPIDYTSNTEGWE